MRRNIGCAHTTLCSPARRSRHPTALAAATLAGAREPVYEGTVVEDADDWRLTAVLALAPMTLAFAYLIVMLFFVFL